jgi:hypothetical protein
MTTARSALRHALPLQLLLPLLLQLLEPCLVPLPCQPVRHVGELLAHGGGNTELNPKP